jgi:hypothetical protein
MIVSEYISRQFLSEFFLRNLNIIHAFLLTREIHRRSRSIATTGNTTEFTEFTLNPSSDPPTLRFSQEST